MSIVESLEVACEDGRLSKEKLKNLDKSCCKASDLEVYDFDAYARLLGGTIPATVDGVRGEGNRVQNRLFLIEMKSLVKTELEFHYGHCPIELRGETPAETVTLCQSEYVNFVKQKIWSFNFGDKLLGTQKLLKDLDETLLEEIANKEVIEHCFLLCDLSFKEFNRYHSTFRAALKALTSAEWGEPMVIPCSRAEDETAFYDYLNAK